MMPSDDQSESETAWIAVYDRYGDYECAIKGNKRGLILLKNAIEEAIAQNGAVDLPKELIADILAVGVTDEPPPSTAPSEGSKFSDFGCMVGLAVIVIVVLLGLYSLFRHGL